MKRLFITFALVTYAGMAAYSLGTLKTRASSSAARPAVSETPRLGPRVTLVTTNLAAMANFYNEVFAADLQPLGEAVSTNYQGRLGSLTLVLSLKQNARGKLPRQRLNLQVSDIAETLIRVATTGGTVEGKVSETATEKRLVVRDPDGNLIELTQTKG